MHYQSICCVCGRGTKKCKSIVELYQQKELLGIIEVSVRSSTKLGDLRTINFCSSCAKKSYTIKDLHTVGSYKDWSY